MKGKDVEALRAAIAALESKGIGMHGRGYPLPAPVNRDDRVTAAALSLIHI